MSDSQMRDNAKQFAKKIVFAVKDIRKEHRDVVLTGQLLRSGTSIGANIHEASYAQGRADFVSKLEIALKECFETEYWLELLYETGYLQESKCKELMRDCGALRRMLIASCKTTKDNA